MKKVLHRIAGAAVAFLFFALVMLVTVSAKNREEQTKRVWYAECERENERYQCDALWDMARHHVRR